MSISTSTLVGFSDLVYKNLPAPGTQIEVNHVEYTVYKTLDDSSSSYQGMILIDQATHSLIVVNRGTQEVTDFAVDAAMADKDVNLQWSDALNLAQQAADYAAANGITNIYAIGHSPDGTKNTAFVGIALQRHEVSAYVPAHVEVAQWNFPNL